MQTYFHLAPFSSVTTSFYFLLHFICVTNLVFCSIYLPFNATKILFKRITFKNTFTAIGLIKLSEILLFSQLLIHFVLDSFLSLIKFCFHAWFVCFFKLFVVENFFVPFDFCPMNSKFSICQTFAFVFFFIGIHQLMIKLCAIE